MMGKRSSFDLEGHGHGGAPVPGVSRIGPFVATSGVRGVDCASATLPDDLNEQVKHMFLNLRTILNKAGVGPENVLKMTIWIAVSEARTAINGPWEEMFPDAASRPARHIMYYSLPGGMLVQCEALAIANDSTEK
jgi:2-iminobutanoate/2-iminopropanoate deaminase